MASRRRLPWRSLRRFSLASSLNTASHMHTGSVSSSSSPPPPPLLEPPGERRQLHCIQAARAARVGWRCGAASAGDAGVVPSRSPAGAVAAFFLFPLSPPPLFRPSPRRPRAARLMNLIVYLEATLLGSAARGREAGEKK